MVIMRFTNKFYGFIYPQTDYAYGINGALRWPVAENLLKSRCSKLGELIE
jgi:hypothetical protein